MALRAYPINSSQAASTVPGVNDFDLTRWPTEFLTAGVKQGGFQVTQHAGTPNMSVDISPGFALIEIENTNVEHGRTYKTWFESTEIEIRNILTADSTNPRKDRVVLRINVSIDPNVNASNVAVVEVLTGTPAGSPSAPAEPDNAITLAIVDVPASDTSITDDQITDSRNYVQVQANVLADLARSADLASTATSKGAALVGIEDAAGDFTGDTVEEALSELADNVLPDAGNVGDILTSDGDNWSAQPPAPTGLTPYVASTANSTGFGASSTSEVDSPPGLQADFNSGELIAGDLVFFEFIGDATIDGSSANTCTVRLKLGSINLYSVVLNNNAATWRVKGKFIVRATSGSNNIDRWLRSNSKSGGSAEVPLGEMSLTPALATQDVSGGAALKITAQFNSSSGSNACVIKHASVYKVAAP